MGTNYAKSALDSLITDLIAQIGGQPIEVKSASVMVKPIVVEKNL